MIGSIGGVCMVRAFAAVVRFLDDMAAVASTGHDGGKKTAG